MKISIVLFLIMMSSFLFISSCSNRDTDSQRLWVKSVGLFENGKFLHAKGVAVELHDLNKVASDFLLTQYAVYGVMNGEVVAASTFGSNSLITANLNGPTAYVDGTSRSVYRGAYITSKVFSLSVYEGGDSRKLLEKECHSWMQEGVDTCGTHMLESAARDFEMLHQREGAVYLYEVAIILSKAHVINLPHEELFKSISFIDINHSIAMHGIEMLRENGTLSEPMRKMYCKFAIGYTSQEDKKICSKTGSGSEVSPRFHAGTPS